MNEKTSRRRRIPNGAWALFAALFPSSECLAALEFDVPQANPSATAVAAAPLDSKGAAPVKARKKIPPPRQFSAEEIRGRLSGEIKAVPRPEPVADRKSPTLIVQPAVEAPPRSSESLVDALRITPSPDAEEAKRGGEGPALVDRPAAEPAIAPIPNPVEAKVTDPARGDGPELRDTAPASVSPAAFEAAAGAEAAAPTPNPDVRTMLANPERVDEALNSLASPSADAPVAAESPVAASDPAQPPQPGESLPGQAPGQAAVPSAEGSASGAEPKKADDQLERTSCATCGGFHSRLGGHVSGGSGSCGGGNCIPGRGPCYPPASDPSTVFGAFCKSLYECLCCPDPCYQPRWVPAANASFFADYARPRTVTRLRYDNLEAMTRPDRNQFMISQVNLPRNNRFAVTNPFLRLQQVSLYQEAAGERGSLFVEMPYRQINPSFQPTQAGFGDINFGVKSLWFDCEMLQVTFQMRTFMPSGNFTNNLGTGQFVVDPSILTSLKLGPETYFQGQFGNWTPVGGPGGANLTDGNKMAGGIFYWLMSVNQVLWHYTPDSPLIATLEMDGWSFENGGYTNMVLPGRNYRRPADGGGVSYFNIGPGLRQSICNRLDFGGAITWATDTSHWAQPWFRFEVRFLF